MIDYDALQPPPSPLFRAYLRGDERLEPFFAPEGWGQAAVRDACARVLAHPRPRQRVADALVAQQRARGATAAAEQAAHLAEPGTVAVVTGQQAVLLGGPLYVLYKALGAMEVARRVAAETGRHVVPVFWVASDDHDFAEVRSTTVLDSAGRLRTLRFVPQSEPMGEPASRIVLDATIRGVLGELRSVMPESLHGQDVLGALDRAYAPGQTVGSAFATFISELLPGLVVLDPSDPALKQLMAPVLVRELAEGSPTSRLCAAAGEGLVAAGFHQQIPLRSGLFNLFRVVDGHRRALAFDGDTVVIRGPETRLSRDEALSSLEADPRDWSPGALLRPLTQDAILPTVAYVAGPAELAYHAQLGGAYEHFGIPRPVIVPRPSLTLVDPPQARALEAEGLDLVGIQADPESVLAAWTRRAYPQVEAAFVTTEQALDRELLHIEETVGALDPTLRGAADAARGRVRHQVQRLHEKCLRALKKRDEARADRLRRTRDALVPGGALQERGLGLVSPLWRHGPGVVEIVRTALDPWATGHQVVSL